MIIRSVEAFTADLRLTDPIRIAYAEIRDVRTVYVKVQLEGGIAGWGEAAASPAITGETEESMISTISTIAKGIIGRDATAYRDVDERISSSMERNPSAKGAVSMAMLDAVAKGYGLPVYKLLGGEGGSIVTDVTIGLDSPEGMAEGARRWVDEGFRTLKLKLGGPVSLDLRRVEAVRDAVGDGVKLRVDVNQAWSLEDSISAVDVLEGLGVELVEQPLSASSLMELSELRSRSTIPIILDESVFGPNDLMSVHEKGAADGINVKLAKSGGPIRSLDLANSARSLGLELMMGCMVESNLALTAAVSVAIAHGGFRFIDLDSDLYLSGQPVGGGFTRHGDELTPLDSPGLSVDVDEMNMERRLSLGHWMR